MQNNIFEELTVVKRSGQRVNFNGTKIVLAIKNAFDSLDSNYSEKDINRVYADVLEYISTTYDGRKTINVEDIQDIIEEKLKLNNYDEVYSSFNSYRLRRAASREVFSIKQQHKFVKAVESLGLQTPTNIYDRPLNIMLGFGKAISKEFARAYLLENKYIRAHDEGIIYIHNLNYYPLYTTSMTHLDFRTINDDYVENYLNQLTDIIYKCKKEQTGEHSVDALDSLMTKVLISNFKSIYRRNILNYLKLNGFIDYININQILFLINKIQKINFDNNIFDNYIYNENIKKIFDSAYSDSLDELKINLARSLRHTLLRLNDFDSNINNNKTVISIGMNNDYEASMISNAYIKTLLEIEKLEKVTTIYKIDKVETISEDVLKCVCEGKNISFSFNHNAEYFSKGEKIYANINDEVLSSLGRGVLSTTSINLSRIGLLNKNKTLESFYSGLSEILDLTKNQLIQRFELQANKYQKNFPNLFKYNLLLDSDKLDEEQKIRKVIKNGVLNISLVGIEECVNFLPEKDKKKLMSNILKFINEKVIQYTNETKLNFIVSQTEQIEVLKELLAIDKAIYGSDNFDKDKVSYSLINYIDIDDIDNYDNLQDLVNMRINIYLRKNSSENKVLETITKVKKKGILYFRINLGKYGN